MKYKKSKKKNLMFDRAKQTMKTGMTTMTGNLVLGNIAAQPGMPAAGVASLGTISGALNLANVGELAKTGMSMTDMFSKNKCGKRHRKRKR
jgi:hypothetical protein